MMLRACLFVLGVLAACQSDGRSASNMTSAKHFIEECVRAGWSVTYPKQVATTLEGLRVPTVDPRALSAEELDAHLDRALAVKGLHADRIGPPSLRVIAIRGQS